VEDKVKDVHNPFEDLKEEFEDSTVNLKGDEDKGRVPLSRKHASLSRKLEERYQTISPTESNLVYIEDTGEKG